MLLRLKRIDADEDKGIELLDYEHTKDVPGVVVNPGCNFWILPKSILVRVEIGSITNIFFYRPDAGKEVGNFSIQYQSAGEVLPRILCGSSFPYCHEREFPDPSFSEAKVQYFWPTGVRDLLHTIMEVEDYIQHNLDESYVPAMEKNYWLFMSKIDAAKAKKNDHDLPAPIPV